MGNICKDIDVFPRVWADAVAVASALGMSRDKFRRSVSFDLDRDLRREKIKFLRSLEAILALTCHVSIQTLFECKRFLTQLAGEWSWLVMHEINMF